MEKNSRSYRFRFYRLFKKSLWALQRILGVKRTDASYVIREYLEKYKRK